MSEWLTVGPLGWVIIGVLYLLAIVGFYEEDHLLRQCVVWPFYVIKEVLSNFWLWFCDSLKPKKWKCGRCGRRYNEYITAFVDGKHICPRCYKPEDSPEFISLQESSSDSAN